VKRRQSRNAGDDPSAQFAVGGRISAQSLRTRPTNTKIEAAFPTRGVPGGWLDQLGEPPSAQAGFEHSGTQARLLVWEQIVGHTTHRSPRRPVNRSSQSVSVSQAKQVPPSPQKL
jgi:hypothetical protein